MRVRDWMRGKSKWQLAKCALLAVAFGGAASVSLEAIVRARLTDSLLGAPTRYYARPIVLEPGMSLEGDRVEASLQRLGYERVTSGDVGIGQYRTQVSLVTHRFENHSSLAVSLISVIWVRIVRTLLSPEAKCLQIYGRDDPSGHPRVPQQ